MHGKTATSMLRKRCLLAVTAARTTSAPSVPAPWLSAMAQEESTRLRTTAAAAGGTSGLLRISRLRGASLMPEAPAPNRPTTQALSEAACAGSGTAPMLRVKMSAESCWPKKPSSSRVLVAARAAAAIRKQRGGAMAVAGSTYGSSCRNAGRWPKKYGSWASNNRAAKSCGEASASGSALEVTRSPPPQPITDPTRLPTFWMWPTRVSLAACLTSSTTRPAAGAARKSGARGKWCFGSSCSIARSSAMMGSWPSKLNCRDALPMVTATCNKCSRSRPLATAKRHERVAAHSSPGESK
mmetsp:Transcript_109547/g.353542  ORF Transcript_109547/g.353542 Transcript_109547/m.353542 type:complete len:297 (-) Transcript_109547:611-1501(-)